MLAEKNKHIRDTCISFEETGHVYALTKDNSEIHPISVTTLIHKFFPEFNADKIIDIMTNKGTLADQFDVTD